MLGGKHKIYFSLASKADMFIKHNQAGRFKSKSIKFLKSPTRKYKIRTIFNWKFFTFADSREPEIAGIGAAMMGSLLTITIFLICAFPIGVMCFYLGRICAIKTASPTSLKLVLTI